MPAVCKLSSTSTVCKLSSTPSVCKLSSTPTVCKLSSMPVCKLSSMPSVCKLSSMSAACKLSSTPTVCKLSSTFIVCKPSSMHSTVCKVSSTPMCKLSSMPVCKLSSMPSVCKLMLLIACAATVACKRPAAGREHAVPAVASTAPGVADAGVARDPLSEASIAADMAWLVDPLRAGRGSTSVEAIATANWLVAELRAVGYQPVVQPIPAVRGQSNVIATYEGPRPGKTSIVMAHYDHVGVVDGRLYPGADDNASGVAVTLAIARDLARRRDVPGKIVFLFTGAEEIDLNGAKAYVAAPTVPLESIRAVYNFDMIGRNFFASAANQPNTIAAVGLPLDADIHTIANEAARDVGLELVAVAPGLLTLVGEDRRSDDWVFRARSVFAVHFSSGLNNDYHQPTDTLDKISIPQLVKVAALVRTILARTPP